MSAAATVGYFLVVMALAIAAGLWMASQLDAARSDAAPVDQEPAQVVAHPSDSDQLDELEELRRRVRALERGRETDHGEVMAQLKRMNARINGQRGGRPVAVEEPETEEPTDVTGDQLDLATQLTAQLAAHQGRSARPSPASNGTGRASAFPPEWFR